MNLFNKILLFTTIVSSHVFANTINTDSILTVYKNIKIPRNKLEKTPSLVLYFASNNQLSNAYKVINEITVFKVGHSDLDYKQGIISLSKGLINNHESDFNNCLNNCRRSLSLLTEQKNELSESQSLIVSSLYSLGKFDSCIFFGNKYLPEINKNKNITSEIDILLALGRSYDFKGDRKKAIEILLNASEIAKTNKKTYNLSEIYIFLSSIYKEENISIAKRYALLSISILGDLLDNNTEQIKASSYLMLGNVYSDLRSLDSAVFYYNLSKVYAQKTNNQRLYLAAIGNIGNIAIEQKEYEKALEYNLMTLFEYKKINIPTEIVVAYGSLADIYKDLKDYKKAIKYYDSALVITKQIQSADDFIYNYKGLSETYDMMGNDKEAFKYYKLYVLWNDSVNNNQNSKKINELELDYKYKAEQREKDLIQKNKDDIIQEKIKQQKYIIWVGILGGLILFIFLGFALKSNIDKKKTNKQLQLFNNEITEQKNIIEEKNHEITDSITYASRIQQGVIPDEDELKELLPHHFVFFKPRDIVSGDFYWACKVKSKTDPNLKRSVVAVVDCTGHGVPGAFMSLVGNTLLNQTINRSAISNPAQALDYINQQLPKTIKSKSSTGTIKDGMEIAMCDFNFDTNTMQFAGANSNIYVVRDGKIQIYRGDKQPIGESFSGHIINYTNQIISLQKNDCVYLISDGYADQFGGVKGKKFKYKQLENLFCAIAEKQVNEQQQVLAKAFDYVLIMGIKI